MKNLMLLVILILLTTATGQEDDYHPPDTSQWIDPTDMIRDVEQQKFDLVPELYETNSNLRLV